MARKVRRPPPEESKYYGPYYNPRADDRSPDRTTHDGPPGKPRGTGVYKGGKAKTVLRDPLQYDRAKKRPTRS